MKYIFRSNIKLLFILIIVGFSQFLAVKTLGEEKRYREIIINLNEIDLNVAKKNSIKELSQLFFNNNLFRSKEDKESWLTNLSSFYDIYKNDFSKVKLFYNGPLYDVVFYFLNGKVFYFHNGLLLPEKELKNADKYSSYYFYYKKGAYEIGSKKGNIFPKPICIDFYREIYGEDSNEIFNNLGRTYVFGHRVSFNEKNGAMNSLNHAVKKIEELSKADSELKRWIKNVTSVDTYVNRNIANEKRISLHSFGIAVDIKFRTDKEIYWYWSEAFRDDWWNIPKEDRAFVPQKVIDAFEENGFAWGGKWTYFDNMHFEYRPEVIFK